MAKKRRKLDQFLSQRKKNQELVLAERTQVFSRVFRLIVATLLMVFLAVLADPADEVHATGVGLLLVVLTILGGVFLNRLHPGIFDRRGTFWKFILLVLITIAFYRFIFWMDWSPYLVPLPMFAMIVAMAYSQTAALLITLVFGFFIGLTSSRVHDPAFGLLYRMDFPLALVATAGGLTAILGVRRIRKQSKPAIVGFYAGIVQAIIIFAIELLRPLDLHDLLGPKEQRVLLDTSWGLLGGIISGGIVTCLLPAIERFFQILTERRLLDLADPSNELLRALFERAPGTYQHTLGVMQLARNAAEAIRGDPLLAHVGTYYHDVGKIVKPEYFVENMGEERGIHDRLRPSMSKMIIISHVKDGIDLAKEAGLPQKVIDMIPMHHGTTVVEYFYQKARRESGPAEDAPGEVEYRYPGPKPRFREAGILMLADVVEAIAKTEAEPNPSRFRAMVHDQILKRLLDGQLDESDLTLNDLRVIEDSFVRTLTAMYHSRIKYPAAGGESRPEADARQAPGAPAAAPKQDTGAFPTLSDSRRPPRRPEAAHGITPPT